MNRIAPRPATPPERPPASTQPPAGGGTAAGASTPLDTGRVAQIASRLGIIVREVPASVEVVNQQTMTEQGYRTTTEAAQGAVGVLAADAAGAPAGYSMRGFDFSQINILYNDINIGPQSFTSRVMDTSVLDRVELNGVIMVANLNRVRDSGIPLIEAVIAGASERLRPVLMTATVATVGMLPAALATGVGSDVQRSLATVVAGGLFLATLLTLFVVPTYYFVIERVFATGEEADDVHGVETTA